jgi:hypothetical protein
MSEYLATRYIVQKYRALTFFALFCFNFPIETACAKENSDFKILLIVDKPPAHPPSLNDLYDYVEVDFPSCQLDSPDAADGQ